jgi:hypothetical protein
LKCKGDTTSLILDLRFKAVLLIEQEIFYAHLHRLLQMESLSLNLILNKSYRPNFEGIKQ